ncbi:MAG: PTS sugar transporter subunit IIA [Atopobiaceae bacterium]|nr:PTS sugar transporter subunit IIA [Atopobiaceae bacterium]
MRYLLLVSHGTFAPGLHSVMDMLMGQRDNILSYSMEDGVGAEEYIQNLTQILSPLTPDDEVVVLGDIIGGSPLTNALNILSEKGLLPHTIAFSGANLPMAIGALMAIEDGLSGDALVSSILDEGKNGVNQITLSVDEDDEEDL